MRKRPHFVPSFFTPRVFSDAARPRAVVAAPSRPAPAPRSMPAAASVAAAPAPVATAPAPVTAPPAPAPLPAALCPVRARLKAILDSPEAVGREDMAKHLAFETAATPAEAIARLAASARAPFGPVASAMAGASIARAALGMAPDPAADMAVAQGVAVALGGPCGADAAASAQWQRDMEEGARTARELLGR